MYVIHFNVISERGKNTGKRCSSIVVQYFTYTQQINDTKNRKKSSFENKIL